MISNHTEPLLFFLLWNFTSQFWFLCLKLMVRNGKYGSSYYCNEKGCDPWEFALPERALWLTMRILLTSLTTFSECFLILLPFQRFPPSLTPWLLYRKGIKTNIRKKYFTKSVCGSLRCCNCYKNISICEVHCRQKVAVFTACVFSKGS